MTLPRFIPDGTQAFEELAELERLAPHDLAVAVQRLVDQGAPVLRANVNDGTAVSADDRVVIYQLPKELKVLLAAVRARNLDSDQTDDGSAHDLPSQDEGHNLAEKRRREGKM